MVWISEWLGSPSELRGHHQAVARLHRGFVILCQHHALYSGRRWFKFMTWLLSSVLKKFCCRQKFCNQQYAVWWGKDLGVGVKLFDGAEETITGDNLVQCHKHVCLILLIFVFISPHLNADVTLPIWGYLLFLVYNNVTESIISPSKFEIGILCSMIVKERKYNSTENRKIKQFLKQRACCSYDTSRARYFCILLHKYFSIFQCQINFGF